jgi:DNA primase
MSDAVRVIKEVLDIVTLIGEHVDLRKTGRNYKGLCPFHAEKTPSFTVNGEKQMFHCFGCGASGDVFAFLMKRQNLEFPEAVRLLAERAGIDLAKGSNGKHQRLFDLMKEAERFYSDNLMKNKKASAYLKEKRGLTEESVRDFSLGCTNGASVVSFLREKGYTEAEICDAGLAVRREGKVRDFFWKRVMFPIVFHGRTRGFGGRTLNGVPKYLNSPATPIFDKSCVLYGLSPSGIRERGYALIVEGYLDVIMCHQYGYKNAVAPLGTALSRNHVKLLRRFTDTFVLMFDGDDAGRKAAIRSSELLFHEKARGGTGLLPADEDPDSLLRKGGDIEPVIRDAMPFSVFLARNVPQSRKRIFTSVLYREPLEIAEFLAYGSSPKEREISAEMSARFLIEKLCHGLPSIVRKGSVEVKKVNDHYLALFESQRFVIAQHVVGDYRQHANGITRKYLLFKTMYQNSKS